MTWNDRSTQGSTKDLEYEILIFSEKRGKYFFLLLYSKDASFNVLLSEAFMKKDDGMG